MMKPSWSEAEILGESRARRIQGRLAILFGKAKTNWRDPQRPQRSIKKAGFHTGHEKNHGSTANRGINIIQGMKKIMVLLKMKLRTVIEAAASIPNFFLADPPFFLPDG
jgi:hypothetical protein